VETDPIRVCELLVGLPTVIVEGLTDVVDGPLIVHVTQALPSPSCSSCGVVAWVKDRPVVELVDLGAFGRATRLSWRKHRWCCPNLLCPIGSWTSEDPAIASTRLSITTRAARWATMQVGRHGRSVSEVAADLGCGWDVVNDAVMLFGKLLVDDPDRIGPVTAAGLDETLFCREGPYRSQAWSTQIVDVRRGVFLDVVEGRDSTEACRWFANRPKPWRDAIEFATLDLSASYRSVFDTMPPPPSRSLTRFMLCE
jgi:transposase